MVRYCFYHVHFTSSLFNRAKSYKQHRDPASDTTTQIPPQRHHQKIDTLSINFDELNDTCRNWRIASFSEITHFPSPAVFEPDFRLIQLSYSLVSLGALSEIFIYNTAYIFLFAGILLAIIAFTGFKFEPISRLVVCLVRPKLSPSPTSSSSSPKSSSSSSSSSSSNFQLFSLKLMPSWPVQFSYFVLSLFSLVIAIGLFGGWDPRVSMAMGWTTFAIFVSGSCLHNSCILCGLFSWIVLIVGPEQMRQECQANYVLQK